MDVGGFGDRRWRRSADGERDGTQCPTRRRALRAGEMVQPPAPVVVQRPSGDGVKSSRNAPPESTHGWRTLR